MKNQFQKITREKHLDHMVNVVPFIVLGHAIQCYVLTQISPEMFTNTAMLVFSVFLATMIMGFIYYDHYHVVNFNEKDLTISFLGQKKHINYLEIWNVKVVDPGQSFSTIILETSIGKHTIFFVDHADELKEWIEAQKQSKLLAA